MKNTNELNQPQKPICSPDGHFARILEELKFVAKEDYPVLFIGDTGVGKEVLVKHLLEHIDMKGEYNAINCSGFSKDLIGSELFGHVKGAFTGADQVKKGLIKQCDNGVLFLDELGAMRESDQAILLRVIEEKRVRKIGSDEKGEDVNVRFIAATNRDETIHEKYKDEGIIQDLKARFYPIHVESLSKRGEDLPYLIKEFLEKSPFKAIELEALLCLLSFDWPQNVRQLKWVIERAKIKRQVWMERNKKEYPNDPSNEILCGFHLPNEIIDTLYDKIQVLWLFTSFHDKIQEHFPVVAFQSVSAGFWHSHNPTWINDDTCLCLPLDENFPKYIGNMVLFIDHWFTEENQQKILQREKGIDNRLANQDSEFEIAYNLYYKENPVLLFDLPWDEAQEKFHSIYLTELFQRYPNSQKERARHYGVTDRALRDKEKNFRSKILKPPKK